MSSSFDNVPFLHEKQEEGSMVCGQHALNALLQESIFSAAELASIGKHLDELEQAQMDPGTAGPSSNYDDSGYFSITVLENALATYGLRLVNWQSEETRPMHQFPEQMSAFILHYQQHYFTIRRFANNPDLWFNLNSFLKQPERVSRMYLGLQIQQSQQEGYTVFAVIPEGDYGSLPPSPADIYFEQHPELAFQSYGARAGPSSGRSLRPRPSDFDLDDGMDAPAAQRKRLSPPGEDDGVGAATSALRGSTLEDDEEEQMRRAIEASLQETSGSSSTQEAWSVPSTSRGTTARSDSVATPPAQAAAGLDDGIKANEAADEDDSPTIEELRRRRLARFQ